ncbi:MAG: hypothetical protein FWF97_00575 [Alphaproteobacteria bacterium]|nr:hypothetical protein [Alphaproteobacteria bacterium]
MKNMLKKIGFAATAVMLAGAAHAATFDTSALCPLINELKGVFNILRILAFVGAAFVLAATGWEAITAKEYKWDTDGKKKLVAMIIGFALLFSVGAILSFLTSGRMGCVAGNW